MKDTKLYLRITSKEKMILSERAKNYGDGSLSGFIRYCIDNTPMPKKAPARLKAEAENNKKPLRSKTK